MKNRIIGLTEKNIRRMYVEEGLSTIRIAKKLNCNDESVRKAMKRYSIPIRSKSDAAKIKDIKPEELRRLKTHFAKLNLNKSGKDHPSWKGGRYIDSYGYVILRIDGKVWKEHRWIMQQYTGKKLMPWEEVNHINGIKTDNSIDNLEVIPSFHKYKDWLRRTGNTKEEYPFEWQNNV